MSPQKSNNKRNSSFLPGLCLFLMMAYASFAIGSEPKIKIRLSFDASESDQRSIALMEKFGPGISEFARFEPHWNASLFRQGTELIALARGNLDMTVTSAQELAEYIPEFSVFTAGYVHRDAAHQLAVFNAPLMAAFKEKAEKVLGVKLLAVMYLGRRQLNLRTEHEVMTPDDLRGINLRMPGTSAWQFLGKALGASPTPMAFSEVYTALQTGAVDGQENPLPTTVYSKFYEVTKQVVLTAHIVDLNYIAFSKSVWDRLIVEQQQALQASAEAAATVGRERQLELESSMIAYLEEQGLRVYSPNVQSFKKRVQEEYLKSEYAKNWPAGLLEKINAL